MAHTPGPWTVYTGHDGDFCDSPYICAEPLREGGKPSAIARLMHGNPDTGANARLIAQAPALLAALELAQQYLAKAVADDLMQNCAIKPRAALRVVAAAIKDARG